MSLPKQFRILFQTEGILEAESASSLNLSVRFTAMSCQVPSVNMSSKVPEGRSLMMMMMMMMMMNARDSVAMGTLKKKIIFGLEARMYVFGLVFFRYDINDTQEDIW